MKMLQERIAHLRDQTGWTQAEIARQAGTSRAAVTDWLNGNTQVLSARVAQQLADASGFSATWLSTGAGSPRPSSATAPPARSKVAVGPGEDKATILISNAIGSMGRGQVQPDDEVIQHLRVRKDWIRQNLPTTTGTESLGILTARGDSMAPTFADGDQLLVDRGVTEINIDGVFVLARNRELFIKRVQRRMRDGAIIIKSDNALFEPETIENGEREQLEVLGRVLWVWRGAKL